MASSSQSTVKSERKGIAEAQQQVLQEECGDGLKVRPGKKRRRRFARGPARADGED
jgi:hypothetical protein